MKRKICLWLAVVVAAVAGSAGPAHAQTEQFALYVYQRVQNWHSGQCVTAFGTSHMVQQWTCGDDTVQQWRIVPVDGTWFELKVASTGQCIEVDGASQDDNHKVVTNACNDRYNQQWTGMPAQVGGGFFYLLARHSGKCLAILSESLVVGANLVQYACSPYSWLTDPIGGSYWRFS